MKSFQGVKLKMDDGGNILIRRYGKSNVYIKSTSSATNEETAIGADVLKAPNQCLEIEKVYKVRSKEYCLCMNLSY
jgi:hypothetical protein